MLIKAADKAADNKAKRLALQEDLQKSSMLDARHKDWLWANCSKCGWIQGLESRYQRALFGSLLKRLEFCTSAYRSEPGKMQFESILPLQ